ncbi:MAG: ABC transporter ATP-binding protein [Finegoldia magna]|uniref:ABC transporter ATP-binding protein n=1 Tax=Finegoldia TaxID=150022 RepID=UPI0026F119C0|nr:ABC transporter ATP-binding protein [Finegoldia magna]MDU1831659.1 ABC transporter ATP-binding protein [Finegoldia magna]MDU2575058.1 ABC transporter ATP-binding protein [Finegoldia magna]MDU7479401.1 ABC transporter ATP-binding protein [Finegoldia magna]
MARRDGIMNNLIFENVSKSFLRTDSDGLTHALTDINMTIEDGEFVCIVGPSGCGKSTLLRLIAGLIVPTTGSITLSGKKVEGTDSDRGMVFQKPTLFPWLTVGENVGFSANLKKQNNEKEVDRLLEKVGLMEFKNSYPHQLSGGMAQRVALIRTMINKPNVFLLDEPLGALDAFTRMNMQDELIRLWQENKHIMIMVTHDVDEAIYLSNKVVIMEPRPGRIKKILEIEMDYPRNRTSKQFTDYRNEILETLNI